MADSAWDDALAEWDEAEDELDRKRAAMLSAGAGAPSDPTPISTASNASFDASSFSSSTAEDLAALGVHTENVSTIEAQIEEQINAKARAAEQAQLERREAQEIRRRRDLRKQQEKDRKEGKKVGGSSNRQASRAAADPAKAKRDAKQQQLTNELTTIDKQVEQLNRAIDKLAGSATGLARVRTQLAAKLSRKKDVEGELRVMKLLAQPLPAGSRRPESGGAHAAAAPVETERERLIRTGAITPFQNIDGLEKRVDNKDRLPSASPSLTAKRGPHSRRVRARPSGNYRPIAPAAAEVQFQQQLAAKRKAAQAGANASPSPPTNPKRSKASTKNHDGATKLEARPVEAGASSSGSASGGDRASRVQAESGSAGAQAGEEDHPDFQMALQLQQELNGGGRSRRASGAAAPSQAAAAGRDCSEMVGLADDESGEDSEYGAEDEDEDEDEDDLFADAPASSRGSVPAARRPASRRSSASNRSSRPKKRKQPAAASSTEVVGSSALTDTQRKQLRGDGIGDGGEEEEDVLFDGGLRAPARIYDNLLDYQQTGLKWLWELHCQRVGGIIGDEMGLGKTIQMIAFLASLSRSNLLAAPSIVVAPATVLRQWGREFETWAPFMKVQVFHESGAGGSQDVLEEVVERVTGSPGDPAGHGIIITTYDQIRTKLDHLSLHRWHYLILDEGHKIRNP